MSFNRRYEVLVGKPYTFTENRSPTLGTGADLVLDPNDKSLARAKVLESYFASERTNSLAISKHQVKFDIEKTGGDSSDGNTAEITLFNLADSTVNFLNNNSGDKTFITLKAGYSDEGMKTIFRGNIVKVVDKREGVLRRTKINVSDGGVFMKEMMTSRSYPKGTKLDKIVDDLLIDIDLPRGSVAKLGDEVVTKHRTIFYGKSVDQLKRVLESHNYAFNVQDFFGYVIARSLEKAKEDAQSTDAVGAVPLITPTTGLIGSPSFTDDSAAMTAKEADTNPPNGISFKCLLNGSLLPNTYVKIQSKDFNGVYRLTKVVHKGGYEGNEWFSECEAEDVALATKSEDVKKEEKVGVTAKSEVKESSLPVIDNNTLSVL